MMIESLWRPTQEYVMPILGLLFLMGNPVKEANVWNYLQRFDVDVWRKHAIMSKLMRQCYLKCRPLSYSNPVEYELLWGRRAYLENTKMKALEYMASLYRKRPQDWPEQYRGRLLKMWRPEPNLRQLSCSSLAHMKSWENISLQLGGIS